MYLLLWNLWWLGHRAKWILDDVAGARRDMTSSTDTKSLKSAQMMGEFKKKREKKKKKKKKEEEEEEQINHLFRSIIKHEL